MGWSVYTSPCGKIWLLCFVFPIVFLLSCGCQCSVSFTGGFMGWSVHTSPCGKIWLLCFVFLIVFLLLCSCQCSVSFPGDLWVGLSTHLFLVVTYVSPWSEIGAFPGCTHLFS